MTPKEQLIERLHGIFHRETRGKTITNDQKYILDWSEKRVIDAIAQAWIEAEKVARLEGKIDGMSHIAGLPKCNDGKPIDVCLGELRKDLATLKETQPNE